jgi:hypothetical protein
MDMAPAPVIVFSSSQRLPDSTLNSSSGDSKLMRGAEALPIFHVWVKSSACRPEARYQSLLFSSRHLFTYSKKTAASLSENNQ